jgi:hypothetical protein
MQVHVLLQREAQKTKWIIDLVMKVDEQYKQGVATQQQQIVSNPNPTQMLGQHAKLVNQSVMTWWHTPC